VARGFIQGYIERGGQTVTTDGRVSTTQVQRSFATATVSVFNAGTLVLATIFSTEAGAPLANPFIADTDGHWGFWADQARYDVQFSGSGITSPYTLFNLETIIASSLVDPGSNGILARTAPNVLMSRTILGTTSAIIVTNGDGSGNPTINLDAGLNFTGKTITGGTYVGPSIANFSNAQHTHQDVVGGGQLNATSIFNTGTVPIPRLPIMVGDSGAGGVAGLVPAPAMGDSNKFLRGDGTWQVTGGGGGTPGSPSLSVQYNNAGAFGGVVGTSSDGTQVTWTAGVLRATSPRITTNILDSNGNAIIALSAVGSSVNNFQVANAGSGGHPVLSVVGSGTDINVVVTPKGAGIITTAGNLQISNNAPQIALIDANDSKTVRIALNGANWSFINDTAGVTPINIDTTSSLVTLVGNLTISKDSPQITLIDTVGGSGNDFIVNRNGSTTNIGRSGQTDLSINNTDGVYTFGQIPVGPASNPTTSNQLSRKQYVDDTSISFSANWFEADPSSSSSGTEDRPSMFLGDGTSMTVSKWRVNYIQGSHTSGGSVSFTLRVRNSAGGSTDLATVTLDNTNNASNTNYTTSFGPTGLAQGDRLTYYISARSGTISERAVSLGALGFQRRT
jgi:hypothetical protein